MSGRDAARTRKAVIAALKFASGPITVEAEGETYALVAWDARRRRSPKVLIDALVADGSLRRAGAELRRTDAGMARLRRLLAGDDPYAVQHGDRTRSVLREDDAQSRAAIAKRTVTVNRAESALARMARLDGGSFLHPELVQAGQRLCSDFERAQLRQRVTMSWDGNGGGSAGSRRAELSDSAIGARRRFQAAQSDLTGELGPATVDLCCFDKGLTDIEIERGWPKRSGKMLLREGLEQLARHYRGEGGS